MRIQCSPVLRFAAKPDPLTPQQIQQLKGTIENHLTNQMVSPQSYSLTIYAQLPHIDINVRNYQDLGNIRKQLLTLNGMQTQNGDIHYKGRQVFINA